MLFIAHQNQNISQSFRKSCHSHDTPSRDKYKRSGSRKIYRRRGETESVKTRRSIDARVFIESFSPLPLPPSSWKMHEATTINSFRHFLDNRETFNRGEGARRRKGVGIEALCAHRIPLWSLAALYHRRHLEKRFPFERANTFSVEGGEVAFLERTQRSHGNLSPSSRAPLAFSLPPRFQRMWVNREMDNLDEFYPEGGKGMTLTSIDFKFVKKRSRTELSNLSLPNIGPFEFLLNETTFIANDCIQLYTLNVSPPRFIQLC